MMYSPTAYWVPSEMWHTLKWPKEEGRIWEATPVLAGSTSAHSQHPLSSFTLPSPEEVHEWMAEAGYIFTKHCFFLPQTTGTCEETNLPCFQIHNLSDTFQKAPLLQQQCTCHRPCVAVPLENKHPQLALKAVTPSERSLAAVCWPSWGCSTALFKNKVII